MKKRNLLIGTVMAVTILATSSAMAFASSEDANVESFAKKGFGGCRNQAERPGFVKLTEDQKTKLRDCRSENLDEALTNLVTEGVFTQAEADGIIEAAPAEPQVRQRPKEECNDMMQNFTDTQKTALRTEMESVAKANLEQLVEDGTITQDQADRMSQRHNNKKGPMRLSL